jgi:hypothetical protein
VSPTGAAGGDPRPTDKCKWCTNVLNLRDVTHSLLSCFQVKGLIDGFSKGDHGKERLATLVDIADTGARPRYITRENVFKPQPTPDEQRAHDPRANQGRGRGRGRGDRG